LKLQYAIHTIIFVISALLAVSCDSADPSFQVVDAEDQRQLNRTQDDADSISGTSDREARPANYSSKSASAGETQGNGDAGDQVDPPLKLEVYKDNGLLPSEGGSVPAVLFDEDKKNLDPAKIVSTFEAEYAANQISDGSLSVDLKDLVVETPIEIQEVTETKSAAELQEVRNLITGDTGSQGYAPAPHEDEFDQNQSGLLDILILTDDSGSMDA
jgi:hypothetical protein